MAYFIHSDSVVIAYSALTGSLDSIILQGGKLNGNEHLIERTKRWVAVATGKAFHVFDATIGKWKTTGISLPDNFTHAQIMNYQKEGDGDDYSILALQGKTDTPGKHYVYTLHHHAFNQINTTNSALATQLTHGYVFFDGWIAPNTVRHIGYSALYNTYDTVEIYRGYAGSNDYRENGTIAAYINYYATIPYVETSTTIWCYSTRTGKWNVLSDIHPANIGYSLHGVGKDYAHFYQSTWLDNYTSEETSFFYSSLTGTYTGIDDKIIHVSGTFPPPVDYPLTGGNVFVRAYGSKAWGYDVRNNTYEKISFDNIGSEPIDGFYTTWISDFAAFPVYRPGRDSMDIYLFDGNKPINNRWLHLHAGSDQSYIHRQNFATDNLYGVFSQFPVSKRKEIMLYSELLGYQINVEVPEDIDIYITNFKLPAGSLCTANARNTSGSFLYFIFFDAQTLIPFTFNFYPGGGIGDSIAVFSDYLSNNKPVKAYGYSAIKKDWSVLTFPDTVTSIRHTGNLSAFSTAGRNLQFCYAYNGISNCWVPLLPEKKTYYHGSGGNFSIVVKDSAAYGFYPYGTTTGIDENKIFNTSNPILFQNYPNPFNKATRIPYKLRENTWMELSIFDMHGKLVSKPEEGYKPAGDYHFEFNSPGLPAGVYYCRLKTSGQVSTIKLIRIK